MKINKTVKTISTNILVALGVFILFLIPMALFNVSFVAFFLSRPIFMIPIAAISLAIAFSLKKNRIIGTLVTLILFLFISFLMITFKTIENGDKEKFIWNADSDSFTIGYTVERDGRIYFNGKINDLSGLFLFDTGSSLTIINEKLVSDKKMKLQPYTLTDANGIKQTKHVFKAAKFELGALVIKRLHTYPADTLSWTDPRGIHYKQDSIFGIIGNNIIAKYTWDFDVPNRKVTVSRAKDYCNTIPDSLAITMVPKNNNYEIEVALNGVNHMLTLDYGCSDPLAIDDSLQNKVEEYKKGTFTRYESGKGALNHLDSVKGRKSDFDFADVKLGPYNYKEIKCNVNGHANLLGIPFMQSFKRVILDYPNNKVYFIEQTDNTEDFAINNFTRQNILTPNGTVVMLCKPQGMKIIVGEGANKIRYVAYGKLNLINENHKTCRIICLDSLLLPNGNIRYGPYTINFN